LTTKIYATESFGSIAALDGAIIFLSPCCGAVPQWERAGVRCEGCGTLLRPAYGFTIHPEDAGATSRLATAIADLATGGLRPTEAVLDLAAGIVGRVGSANRHPSRGA